MRKSTRIVKKLLALFLVVLMSINSFGAVVSDNDGSAFITKAEFDSLKNDFQTQIDQYNTSIDSKIDGAIAAYLSGLTIAKEQKINPLIENYSDIRWVNGLFEKTHRKTFTSDASSDGVLEWRRPYFNNHRYERLNRVMLTIPVVYNGEQLGFVVWFTLSPGSNSKITGVRDSATDTVNNWGPGVKMLELHKNANGKFVYNINSEPIFMEENCMSDFVLSAPILMDESTYPPGATEYFWNFVRGNRFVGWQHTGGVDTYLRWNSLNGSDEFLDFDFRIRGHNGSTWTAQYFAGQNIELRSNNCNIGTPHAYSRNPKEQESYRSRYNIYDTSVDYDHYPEYRKYGTAAYRDRYDTVEQAEADKNQFNYMMLGVDDENFANVGYVIENTEAEIGYTLRFDFSDTEWIDVPITGTDVTLCPTHQPFSGGINMTTVKNIGRCGQNGNVYGTIIDCDMTSSPDFFRLPLWNRVKVQELVTDNYKYNGLNNLRLGEGIPLALNLMSDGKFILKFKYEVKDNDQSATGTPDNEIKLYIKKGDFLTSNNFIDYYTAEDGKSLNGYTINTNPDTMNTVEFEAKQGDNIWLRLSPKKLDPSGIYAKITDLSLTLETN